MMVNIPIEGVFISIVIPVKNGKHWIEACIKGIQGQTLAHLTEIIVIDSGSTDGTLELLKDFPVKLIKIEPGLFNHGLTRNVGVNAAQGEYVVLTVQDARPADEFWLEKLLEGFTDDTVAGVCGSQIVPHETDKNPIDWFRPSMPPTIRKYQIPNNTFASLDQDYRRAACGWDNVNAMYKRSVLLQIPFEKTIFGEDAIWAKAALEAGYTLVYYSAARVYHYHHESYDFVFKRMIAAYYVQYKQLGLIPVRKNFSFRRMVSIYKTLLFNSPGVSIGKVPYWIQYNENRRKAMIDAYKTFSTALEAGECEVEAIHKKYCNIPPSPLQK